MTHILSFISRFTNNSNNNNNHIPYRRLIGGVACVLVLAILCMSVVSYVSFNNDLEQSVYYFLSGSAYTALNDTESILYSARSAIYEISQDYIIRKVWFGDEITTADTEKFFDYKFVCQKVY